MLYQEREFLQTGWTAAWENRVKRWLAILLVCSFLFGTLDGSCAEYYIDCFAAWRMPARCVCEAAGAGKTVAETVGEAAEKVVLKTVDSAGLFKEKAEQKIVQNTVTVPEKREDPGTLQEEVHMQMPENETTAEAETGEENMELPGIDETVPEGDGTQTGGSENFMIQGFQIDENGMICAYDPSQGNLGYGRLELPDKNCVGIRKDAFANAGAGIEELYIPRNITQIETGALSYLQDLSWIEVEAGNTSYVSADGILMDVSGTSIYAFPPARIGCYALPEYAERIADGAFGQTALSKLDLRGCGNLAIGNAVFGASMGYGIELIVPEQSRTYYEQIFSGYSVTFNPVSEV